MPTSPKSVGESRRTTTSKAAQDTNWLDQLAKARHARFAASDVCFAVGAGNKSPVLACSFAMAAFGLSKSILHVGPELAAGLSPAGPLFRMRLHLSNSLRWSDELTR